MTQTLSTHNSSQVIQPRAEQRLLAYLQEPISGLPLALFRILFGVLLLVSLIPFSNCLKEFVGCEYRFSYIENLYIPNMQTATIMLGVMAFCSVNIALGLFYRISCAVAVTGITYFLLADKTFYQNQIYLTDLISFLLMLVPADSMLSFDNADGSKPRTVPRWTNLIFLAQISIVYIFTAIGYMNSDWMNGYPQLFWVMKHSHAGLLKEVFRQKFAMPLVTYGFLALNFGAGLFLLPKQTRWISVTLFSVLLFFSFGQFKHNAMQWIVLFSLLFALPPTAFRLPWKGENIQQDTHLENDPQVSFTKVWSPIPTIVLLYLLVQLAVPLRQFLYPRNLSWNMLGTKFSWVSMTPIKELETFEITKISGTENQTVSIDKLLSKRQFKRVWAEPDLLYQFAKQLASKSVAPNSKKPQIKINLVEALLNRAPQNLVDPNLDLAAQSNFFLKPSWVLDYKDKH